MQWDGAEGWLGKHAQLCYRWLIDLMGNDRSCSRFAQCRSGHTASTFCSGYTAIIFSRRPTSHFSAICSTFHCEPPIHGHTLYTHPHYKGLIFLPSPRKILVPDSWRFQDEEQSKCCHQNRCLRRGPVTDILLWIECYASMVAVLSSGFPQKTPELMAYQKTIVRAYRSFSGDGWVTYDSCYRRKAAITKSLDWGQVDFTLYNETFTGRAKPIARCKFCLSEHHFSSECGYAPEVPSHKPESVTSVRLHYDSGKPHTPICHLFNNKAGNICRFNPCRFGHVCIVCRGSHPASVQVQAAATQVPSVRLTSWKRSKVDNRDI